MLDSDRGPVPHRGPISTTGANLIPHRGPILIVPQRGPISNLIRGNVKILRDDVVRFTALPMMTLKINDIIKIADFDTEILLSVTDDEDLKDIRPLIWDQLDMYITQTKRF